MREPIKDRIQTITAKERIEGLEFSVNRLIEAQGLAVDKIREIEELQGRIIQNFQAMINLMERGEKVSGKSINQEVVDKEVEFLKAEVDELKKRGEVVPEDLTLSESFVILQEIAATEGPEVVINPRIQFLVSAVNDANLQARLIGKKVGDIVAFKPESNLKIIEIYKVVKVEETDGTSKVATTEEQTRTPEETKTEAQV